MTPNHILYPYDSTFHFFVFSCCIFLELYIFSISYSIAECSAQRYIWICQEINWNLLHTFPLIYKKLGRVLCLRKQSFTKKIIFINIIIDQILRDFSLLICLRIVNYLGCYERLLNFNLRFKF